MALRCANQNGNTPHLTRGTKHVEPTSGGAPSAGAGLRVLHIPHE